jgi:HSP20 family protein
MAMRNLTPWKHSRELGAARGSVNPFMSLRQEMDRLFDDTFRGFGLTPFGTPDRLFEGAAWPSMEVAESDKEIKVMAELPGIDEKNVEVELVNGMLCISGEKKEETEDKERRFSERYYGRFERRIPVEDVDENKVSATFKNGVLTVVLQKAAGAAEKTKRIPISH